MGDKKWIYLYVNSGKPVYKGTSPQIQTIIVTAIPEKFFTSVSGTNKKQEETAGHLDFITTSQKWIKAHKGNKGMK